MDGKGTNRQEQRFERFSLFWNPPAAAIMLLTTRRLLGSYEHIAILFYLPFSFYRYKISPIHLNR